MYTGCRRPIECLELQVIFRKRATNSRALLRKITYEDKASSASSPPCIISCELSLIGWEIIVWDIIIKFAVYMCTLKGDVFPIGKEIIVKLISH